MSLMEAAYRQAGDTMTPVEKLGRMHGLLHWIRDLVRAATSPEVG